MGFGRYIKMGAEEYGTAYDVRIRKSVFSKIWDKNPVFYNCRALADKAVIKPIEPKKPHAHKL